MANFDVSKLPVKDQKANAAYIRIQCVKSAPKFDRDKPFAIVRKSTDVSYFATYEDMEAAAIAELKMQLLPIRKAIADDVDTYESQQDAGS